jgi:hypothetical protein
MRVAEADDDENADGGDAGGDTDSGGNAGACLGRMSDRALGKEMLAAERGEIDTGEPDGDLGLITPASTDTVNGGGRGGGGGGGAGDTIGALRSSACGEAETIVEAEEDISVAAAGADVDTT